MRIVLLTLTLFLTGCLGPGFEKQLTDAIVYGPDRSLWIALYSFREGRGDWPASPDELGKSPFVREELRLDHYENLKFESLPDGRLAVSFDRYTSPDEKMTWSNSRIEVGEPAAH